MIDDTGPRITALERRVDAIEREAVRFADLRAVLLSDGDNGELVAATNPYWTKAQIDRIEQARAAREDQTTGGGGKLHPRDSSSRNHAEASEVLGSNPSPPTTYAAQRLIAAALAAADTWTDANQSYRVPLMDAAKAYRAARQDSGGGVATEPDVQAKAADGTTANGTAATPTPSPTLAEAMEALRYACEIHGDDRIFDAAPHVLAAWDRERPDNKLYAINRFVLPSIDKAQEWCQANRDAARPGDDVVGAVIASQARWKARAEAGEKLLKTAADLLYQSNDVDEYREVEKAIRAHLKGTP